MSLRDLDPESRLRDPARKQAYVTTLFDTVAPTYDRFTRLFSFGMDARWKRRLAQWVADVVRPGDLVVDLACGTGAVLAAVDRETHRSARLVGLDPSGEMLGFARPRLRSLRPATSALRAIDPAVAGSIALLRGDMTSLPLRPCSASAVTVGYGFRNTPAAEAALAEVARVLRPGGWLFTLDFFRPERGWWRRLYLWYLGWSGRLAGRWWHADPEAYGYIARSLDTWVTPSEFRRLLDGAGFAVRRVRVHLGGGICLHAAQLQAQGTASDRAAKKGDGARR